MSNRLGDKDLFVIIQTCMDFFGDWEAVQKKYKPLHIR